MKARLVLPGADWWRGWRRWWVGAGSFLAVAMGWSPDQGSKGEDALGVRGQSAVRPAASVAPVPAACAALVAHAAVHGAVPVGCGLAGENSGSVGRGRRGCDLMPLAAPPPAQCSVSGRAATTAAAAGVTSAEAGAVAGGAAVSALPPLLPQSSSLPSHMGPGPRGRSNPLAPW